MPDPVPVQLDLTQADTGDPKQQEKTSPPNVIEANDRRTIRQAIMTQLLREIADEIVKDDNVTVTCKRKGIVGNLRKDAQNRFPRLFALMADPEKEYNAVRDRLYVSQEFGSINIVVFRNAMAITDNPDVEEVAKRVVIRSGISGKYSDRGFAGCK